MLFPSMNLMGQPGTELQQFICGCFT